MRRILSVISLALIALIPLFSQTTDTTMSAKRDTLSALIPSTSPITDTSKTKRDSVIHIIPIPEVGSIEPFGTRYTTITDREITNRDYRSLYDILSHEQGIFNRDLASPGHPNQLVIDGIDDRNIAIMVDGILYNDYTTGSFNLWNIPVESIERVELITGSRAMFYDGRSAGGVINIVTKNFNNNRAVTALRFSQGVNNYGQTDASFSQNIANGANLSFALAHNGFGSDKEYQNYQGRFLNSNHDAWMVRSKLRYNITDWFGVTARYSYDRSWTGLFGGVDRSTSQNIFDGLTANVVDLESYQKQFNSHYSLTAAFYPYQDSTILTTFTVYAFDRLREYRNDENRSLKSDSILLRSDLVSAGRGMKVNLMSQYTDLRFIAYADLARIQSTDIITAGIKAEILPRSFFTLTPFVTFKDTRHQFLANGGVDAVITLPGGLTLNAGLSRKIINDLPISTTNTLRAPATDQFTAAADRPSETFSIAEAGIRYAMEGFSAHISYRHYAEYEPAIYDTLSVAISSAYYQPEEYQFDAISAGLHLSYAHFHLEGTAAYHTYPSLQRNTTSVILFPAVTAHGSFYYKGFLADGALDLKFGIRGTFTSEQNGMRPYDILGIWIPSSQFRFGNNGTADLFAVGKIGDAYIHLIWENLGGNDLYLAPIYPLNQRNIRFGVTWEFLD